MPSLFDWMANAAARCAASSFRFFPGRCILCRAQSNRPMDLCCACEADLPRIHSPCRQCGLSVLGNAPGREHYCAPCLVNPPPYDRSFSAFKYASPVRQLITEFKQHRQLVVGEMLSQVLARRFQQNLLEQAHQRHQTTPDILIPMPLHPSRMKSRGFNQAELIAQVVGRQTGITCDTRRCHRVKQTEDQKGLTAADRRTNIRGAFSVVQPLHGEYIVIVDDVMTTAATVSELARCLRRAGAGTIEILTLARTPAPK
ncbi:MAG: ComF family protein [Candidatus Pseudothioglobus sp.]|jgi:ComF family protein